jgi:hypothetical protein
MMKKVSGQKIKQGRKKMSDNSTVQSGGIGFFGLLAIVFITLKLLGYITWPWLWVLAPIWLPFAIAIVLAIVVFIFAFATRNWY